MVKVKQGILLKTDMGLECRYVNFKKQNGNTVSTVAKEPVIFICHSSDLNEVLDLFANQFNFPFEQYLCTYLDKPENEKIRETVRGLLNDNS